MYRELQQKYVNILKGGSLDIEWKFEMRGASGLPKLRSAIHGANTKDVCLIVIFQIVTRPDTNHTYCCLTSVIQFFFKEV